MKHSPWHQILGHNELYTASCYVITKHLIMIHECSKPCKLLKMKNSKSPGPRTEYLFWVPMRTASINTNARCATSSTGVVVMEMWPFVTSMHLRLVYYDINNDSIVVIRT